jgi:hypothetical protein
LQPATAACDVTLLLMICKLQLLPCSCPAEVLLVHTTH